MLNGGNCLSMTTYILLRNNKESGPFSLENLRSLGLKPNDLVWAEGQSVCWLFPGEIKELKDLVGLPPQETVKETVTVTETVAAPEKEVKKTSVQAATPVLEKVKPTTPDPIEKPQPVYIGYSTAEEESWKKYIPREEKQEYNLQQELKEEPVTEINYSRPLSEIKELYVKNLHKQTKQKSKAIQINLPPGFKKVALYAGLVVAGLMAGMLFKGKKSNKEKAPVQANLNTRSNTQDNQDVYAPVTIEQPPVENSTANIPVNESRNEKPIVDQDVFSDQSTTNAIRDRSLDETITDKPVKKPVEKETRTDPEENVRTSTVPDLRSEVSVKSNDYIVASFGGIRNLELTVTNDSRYPLKKVAVELQYLKPRDELLRTEIVNFYQVPANGKQTQAIKKSTRGIKVAYRIIDIDAQQAE
jgi:hypothetical protein